MIVSKSKTCELKIYRFADSDKMLSDLYHTSKHGKSRNPKKTLWQF